MIEITPEEIKSWSNYSSKRSFQSEQEARDWIFRQLELNDGKGISTEKDGSDYNREYASQFPIYQPGVNTWKIGKPVRGPSNALRLKDIQVRLPSRELVNQIAQATFLGSYKISKLTWVPIQELLGEDNSLYTSQPQEISRIQTLAQQFKQNKWIEAVVVGYEQNGERYVIEGQHRVRAMRLLGFKTVPAIIIMEEPTVSAWIQQNCKFASHIPPPPAMVKRVLEEVIKFRQERQRKEKQISIPVDLTGWKYGDADLINKWMERENAKNQHLLDVLIGMQKNETTAPIMLRLQEEISSPREPSIMLQIIPYCTNNPGHWRPMLNALMICADPNVGEFLQTAIEHELTHFAQNFLSFALTGKTDIKETGIGLPSKNIRTPEFKQDWTSEEDFWKQQRNWHLDDAEFYTILQDRKNEARGASQILKTTEDRIRYIKTLIIQDKFFISLKANPSSRGKFQKAVSEVWKAMNSMEPNLQNKQFAWVLNNCKFAMFDDPSNNSEFPEFRHPDFKPEEKKEKIVKYPFSKAKRDSKEGWYFDWKNLPGDIFLPQGRINDINSLSVGDMVEDAVAGSTPYWKITWIDPNIGRVYVDPIEPNPFISNVGAGGKELTDFDYSVHSGDYEKGKVDDYLDMVRSGKYSDVRDVTYLLKGTVPMNFGPNGAQGGWYNATDIRSNRGGQQGLNPVAIMMNDAKTIQQKLKLDVPPAALNGDMDPHDWTDFVNGDTNTNNPNMALNGENWEDPETTINFVLNHPQPQIKKRNLDALINLFNPFPRQQINQIWQEEPNEEAAREKGTRLEEAYKRGDFMNKELEPKIHQLLLNIASLKHPVQDKTGFDPYYLTKEQAIRLADNYGWTDVLDTYMNSHDEDNRAEVARIFGENKQVDKLLQMEVKEKNPKALIGIIRGLYTARYPLGKILQTPKYLTLGNDYYSKELKNYINYYTGKNTMDKLTHWVLKNCKFATNPFPFNPMFPAKPAAPKQPPVGLQQQSKSPPPQPQQTTAPKTPVVPQQPQVGFQRYDPNKDPQKIESRFYQMTKADPQSELAFRFEQAKKKGVDAMLQFVNELAKQYGVSV